MSGIRGKGTVSVKKKKDALSRLASTGYKNLEFMHEASAGDTIISLQSLSAPAQAVANGFAQPNAVDLAKVDLRYYKSNLILRSTLGSLTPFIDYKISGAQTIELLREAEDGEIFIGTLQTVARTGQTLVDAAPLVVTGTLLAGQTDFSVGPYEVGKFPGQDHGSVLVIEDGQIVYRNDGNAEASLAVSGDYQEVSNIIRFNTTSPDDRQISVVSIGALVSRPQESFDAVAEALQGQIDAIVPTLAALAGVSESTFQATPNNTDLKAFGDRVLALEKILDAEVFADENTFSARITNNGAAAAIESQNTSFIQSVNRSGLGHVDIVFVPGFFTQTPSVVVTRVGGFNDVAASAIQSATGVTVFTDVSDARNGVDANFSIIVQRQGSDYKVKKTIRDILGL